MQVTYDMYKKMEAGTVLWGANEHGYAPYVICKRVAPGFSDENWVVSKATAPADYIIRTGMVVRVFNDQRTYIGQPALYDNEAEAEAHWRRDSAKYYEMQQKQREAEEAKRRKYERLKKVHDKLYAEAMALAADTDDMDVVEHYCQGSISRLRKFIKERKKLAS